MSNPIADEFEMPDEVDFTSGTRGLHHIHPEARVLMPASIERSVWEHFSRRAEQEGIGLSELLTAVLKRDIALHDTQK
jgi:hypothetical protein